MNKALYPQMLENATAGVKKLCLLIDPDKYTGPRLAKCMELAIQAGVSYVFVGGSLLTNGSMSESIRVIRESSDLPVILFPGSTLQFTEEADALLFLSLISGRNADLLIGRHVEIAPALKKSSVEVIPTGYMLVDGGVPTTASFMSNTFPIPHNKADIAACTAMAGELLGLKLIYLDGGSGAARPVSPEMITQVKGNIGIPLVVGGGIRTPEQLSIACTAGADLVVIGNIIEDSPQLLPEFGRIIQSHA